MWAHDLYGGPPPVQPNPSAAALGLPRPAEAPEVNPRTPGLRGSVPNVLANPTLLLVGLLALAALLINFTIRLEVSG